MTTPDADSGEIYLVGDSVMLDKPFKEREKTKSCRRGKKYSEKKKKKEKQQERQAAKSQHIS